MPDLNWLYSAVAQSAAAIVAIIGGFITSRILMLSGEKRRLKEEKALKDQRAKGISSQLKEVEKELKLITIENFLDECSDDIVNETELPSIEELLRRHPDWARDESLDRSLLTEEYNKISCELLKIRAFLKKCIDDGVLSAESPWSLREFLRESKTGIEGLDYNLLSKNYERYVEILKNIERERRRKMTSINLLNFTRLDMDLDLIKLTTTKKTQWEILRAQQDYQKIHSLKERQIKLTADQGFLQREIKTLEEKIKSFKYPEGIYLGIAILAYLAVVGIIVPLCFIPAVKCSQNQMALMKTLVISLFGSGILGVFWFIFQQLRVLTKK